MDDLQAYLDSVRNVPFQWGEHDCALYAAKWMDAKAGTDLAERVRAFGLRSARDYRRLQRQGKSLEAMTIEVLGDPERRRPQRGDIVLVRTVNGASLGIAVPPLILCAGAAGIEPVAMSGELPAWSPSCRR